MSHRIAPPQPLPEFYLEAGYLTDFLMRWKMNAAGEIHEAIDLQFLAHWHQYRVRLARWGSGILQNPRHVDTVHACLTFVDALVSDWYKALMDKDPAQPLDTLRLQELETHWRKLNSIPGDEQRIWY
jgi:hypothetical protein